MVTAAEEPEEQGAGEVTPCAKCGQVHLTPHGTPACAGHSKQTGKPCRRGRPPGGTVCRYHGGAAPQVVRARARRLALGEAMAAVEAERQLGRVLPVEPADAMLAMVHEAAANVAVLRHLVQQLDTALGPGGIAGATGSTAKVNEAAPHVLVTMYADERERLVRWAKACRDAGVDERRVALVEAQAEQVAQVVRGVQEQLLAVVLAVLEGDVRARVEAVWGERWPGIAREQLALIAVSEGGHDA